MATQRKQYSAEFKARVALEALKGHKTMNELVSIYGVHPTQLPRGAQSSALPANWSTQGRTRLAEKNIWTGRLMPNVRASSRILPRSAWLGSASF